MKFKEPELQAQFNELPPRLQEIGLFFDQLSDEMGIDAVATRIWDPVPGDSGVHEAHRAIDFRDETRSSDGQSAFLYTADQVNHILTTINNQYPRTDGKLVAIHHSFNGMPYHFHLQIPIGWIGQASSSAREPALPSSGSTSS